MAFLTLRFYSEALDLNVPVSVILPERNMGIGVTASMGDCPPKVLYLLHGYSDDDSIWSRRTSIELFAAGHHMAVVMPGAGHSFYMNEPGGERYWDFLSEELPARLHQWFRLSSAPEDTFVAGLSMGGYGAMRLALTHPERFSAAGSYSGVLDLASWVEDIPSGHAGIDRQMGLLFPDRHCRGTEHDLFHLLTLQAGAPSRPRLFVACGTADSLFPMHGRFIEAARASGWSVQTLERDGAGHEWPFWNDMVHTFIEHYC